MSGSGFWFLFEGLWMGVQGLRGIKPGTWLFWNAENIDSSSADITTSLLTVWGLASR
jgi:hypothetical protein